MSVVWERICQVMRKSRETGLIICVSPPGGGQGGARRRNVREIKGLEGRLAGAKSKSETPRSTHRKTQD